MTITADEDITTRFNAALAQDAGVTAPAAEPAAPAPPRKPDPAEGGEKPATRPARKPRPSKDEKARTAPPQPELVAVVPRRDYTAGLTDFGNQVWLGASMLRGGKILGIKIPDARPLATVWKECLPDGVIAWNRAAQQNATVRRYVSRLDGEGGVSWVFGVAFWAAGLVAAADALRAAPAGVREQVIEKNDQMLAAYITEQVEAMGLEVPKDPEEQAA